MKKIIPLAMIFFILFASISTFALNDVATVEIKIVGEIERENDIEILVDVKNINNLYAASIDFIYDSNQLKVYKIEPTNYIKDNKGNIMELGGEVDKGGNTATYSFTFLGELDGLNNQGTLVKIKAKVIDEKNFVIAKDSMKIKLVQKVGDSVKNYEYNFIGYHGLEDNNSSSDRDNKDKIESSSNDRDNNNNSSNNIKSNNDIKNNNSFNDNTLVNNKGILINEDIPNIDENNQSLGDDEGKSLKDDSNNIIDEKKNNKVTSTFLDKQNNSWVYMIGFFLVFISFLSYHYKVKNKS